MNLKILIPFQVFAEKNNVTQIIAETSEGSFGILSHRLDCIAALIPGILIYELESEPEIYVAIDNGILVKTGTNVIISVRRAIVGTKLEQLRQEVEKEFKTLDEKERSVHMVLSKMERGFLNRLSEFQHGR